MRVLCDRDQRDDAMNKNQGETNHHVARKSPVLHIDIEGRSPV